MTRSRLVPPSVVAVAVLWAATVAHAQESDGSGIAGNRTVSASGAGVSRIETSMVGIDDAWTTDDSMSELELTLVYSQALRAYGSDGSTSDRGTNDVGAGVVTFTHGLAPRLDLAASMFGVSFSDEDEHESRNRATSDLFVDVKWHFGGNAVDGLQLAYRPGLSIPIGSQDRASAQA